MIPSCYRMVAGSSPYWTQALTLPSFRRPISSSRSGSAA